MCEIMKNIICFIYCWLSPQNSPFKTNQDVSNEFLVMNIKLPLNIQDYILWLQESLSKI